MPKRTWDHDNFCSKEDSFSLFPPAGTLGLPESDTAWAFSPDADPTKMPLFDFEFMDMDNDTQAEILAGQDLFTGYLPSKRTSPTPAAQSALDSSTLFLSSLSSATSSPPFPASVERQTHTGQVSLCRSLDKSKTCLTAALRILTNLHVAHSSCLSGHQEHPSVQQAWKMETVLSTNRDVIASMAPILACSCSAKSLVQLLLASVCGKLITWNSAMINAVLEQGDLFDGRESTFSSASSFSAGPAQAPMARVLSQPITNGQHQVNGSLGRALHAQVAAGELRTLESLIDALSRRFTEASSLDCASSTSPAPQIRNGNVDTASLQSKTLSIATQRHLVSSLRTRL